MTPGPSTAPAFQHPAPDDTILRQQLSDLTVDTDRLKQRVSQLEARLDLLLTITTQQHSPAASPSPSSAVPVTHDDLLRIIRQTLSTDGFSRQMLRFFSLQ